MAFIIMLQVITQPLYAKVKEVFLLIKYWQISTFASCRRDVRARRLLRPRVFAELSLNS